VLTPVLRPVVAPIACSVYSTLRYSCNDPCYNRLSFVYWCML